MKSEYLEKTYSEDHWEPDLFVLVKFFILFSFSGRKCSLEYTDSILSFNVLR